jgi:hypothetical protein
MQSKRITAGFWDYRIPTSRILDVGRSGVDAGQMQKVASDNLMSELKNIKPEKGYAFVHVITNGDGAHYSSNTNGDYFNEGPVLWTFPEARQGLEKTAMLKGGLKEFHNWTYNKYGGVYTEHRNSRKKDPKTGKPYEKQGDIGLALYNDRMHRGELVLKLPINKWQPVLDKIAKEEPVTWSMGSAVPYDICSRCHNRAKSRKDYCDHLKYLMNKTAADGGLICAINDETYYHDISHVYIPAEKIAFTLEKVASGERPLRAEYEAEGLWLPAELVDKLAGQVTSKRYVILQKLASLEKELECGESSLLQMAPAFKRDPKEETDLAAKLSGIPLEQLFSTCAKKQMLLPPRTFAIILVSKGKQANPELDLESELPWLDLLPGKVRSLFSSCPFDDLEDGAYTPDKRIIPAAGAVKTLESCEGELSLAPAPVTRRITISVLRGDDKQPSRQTPKADTQDKEAGERNNRIADLVAREYAKYQISFLHTSGDESLLPLVVLQNLQA